MGLNVFPSRGDQTEVVTKYLRFTGAGAANPTKNFGNGMTVTWVSTGLYRITFADRAANGFFMGALPQFESNAPGAATPKLIEVDRDSYDTTNYRLEITVTDPGTEAVAPALSDLSSTEAIYMEIKFQRNGPRAA